MCKDTLLKFIDRFNHMLPQPHIKKNSADNACPKI